MKNVHIPAVLVVFLIGLGFVLYGLSIGQHHYNVVSQSTLDLNPTPSAVSPTVEVEPEVNNWMPYNNDKFNFSINVPDGWKSQDYSSQANGGAQIAFSPNSLPCDTCTYFYDGFFSIKIYNQKTSPDAYADYQQRLAFIGKKEGYQQIKIGAAQGVLAANTVALASQGYIYELSLDEDHGSKNAVDSKIFMNVLSSIKFTGLAF